MRKLIKFLPNSITVSRILMTFVFGYSAYLHGHNIFLLALFLTICISDLSDGKIARKFQITSVLGAKLDVFADLFYMLVAYSVFISLKIIPVWFLTFICIKFIEFTITSKIIRFYDTTSENPFVFDKVGRIVAAVFYIIPGLACMFDSSAYFINLILYVTLAAGIYSSYMRIRRCFVLSPIKTVELTIK
ncbi:CDP-alcohol phosphatidyltransferase family protein [Clostridium sp. 19966]|uniref:CDP-alcohol phosphatidyltransferase family protein n=1 Tax=Clostridium sp. 19966 TaxID=2768166 RepID=UPI0028DE643E|nr:CDP-alcohol phosphatidyltransferase family protein [Clostridium sp. 19966]MDT8716831.1 CDP-alcohol phosphatidyltransferase family protein [Clostridium sp. 19966]